MHTDVVDQDIILQHHDVMKPACRYYCIWQCRAEVQRTTSSQVEIRDSIRVERLATHWTEGCDLRSAGCNGELEVPRILLDHVGC